MALKDFLNAFKTKNTDKIAIHLDPSQTDTLIDILQTSITKAFDISESCKAMSEAATVQNLEVVHYINHLEKELRKSELLLKKYHKLLTDNELCMNDWEAKYKLMTRTKRTIASIKKLKDEHEAKKNAEAVK